MGSTAKHLEEIELEIMDERAELIDGEVVYKALPSGRHGHIESSINRVVGTLFHRKKRNDGRGGWWILTEVQKGE